MIENKKDVLKLTIAFALVAGLASNAKASDIGKWCDDNITQLNLALTADAWATSDTEGRDILVQAAKAALESSKRRFEKYFRYTLQTALDDYKVIYPTSVARQDQLLRRHVHEAISDLVYLSNFRNYLDSGNYVREMLQRGSEAGEATPNNYEEVEILTLAIQRAEFWLTDSDFVRTESYACTYKTLQDTLNSAATPSLTEEAKIERLRSGVEAALKQLVGGC